MDRCLDYVKRNQYVELSTSMARGWDLFFIANIVDRKSDVLEPNIDNLRDAIRRVKNKYPFEIVVRVVLPDHLRCIWKFPEGDADFALKMVID